MNSDTSDLIANIVKSPILKPKVNHTTYSIQYREKVFYIWYNKGKPPAPRLAQFIPPELDEYNRTPTPGLLRNWIDKEFSPRAKELDEAVKAKMDALMMAEKIEMLKRHADVGLQMQDMAIQYLNENRDELSAPAAVRMLVEGIRIERESRGIPAALDKMLNMSDEQLMKEVQKLITEGSTLEEIDANSE